LLRSRRTAVSSSPTCNHWWPNSSSASDNYVRCGGCGQLY
jgi:hypothetical protein